MGQVIFGVMASRAGLKGSDNNWDNYWVRFEQSGQGFSELRGVFRSGSLSFETLGRNQ